MNQLLDVQATARLLSLSTWTIRAYLRSGKLSPVRIGRRVLLEEAEVQRFIDQAKKDTKLRATPIPS